MSRSVIVEATLQHTTEKAALFIIDDKEVWVPLSQIDITAWDIGDCDDLELPKWLADKNELDYDED